MNKNELLLKESSTVSEALEVLTRLDVEFSLVPSSGHYFVCAKESLKRQMKFDMGHIHAARWAYPIPSFSEDANEPEIEDELPPPLADSVLSARYQAWISGNNMPPVREAVETACNMGYAVYLVGGGVRDLFLGAPATNDVDLAVEGDAIRFGEELAHIFKCRSRIHYDFKTVNLHFENGGKMDIAMTRRERYNSPGALPKVSKASIEEDLQRRDFTINAMSLPISPDGISGPVTDLFGGREDLASGLIRPLHPISFLEDPTRAFRAVRYAARFGFKLSLEAKHQIEASCAEGLFQKMTGKRLTNELYKILEEKDPVPAFRLMMERKLWGKLFPDRIPLPREVKGAFTSKSSLGDSVPLPGFPWWIYRLLVLLWEFDRRDIRAYAQWSEMPHKWSKLIAKEVPLIRRAYEILSKDLETADSEIGRCCSELSQIGLKALDSLTDSKQARDNFSRYVSAISGRKPLIDGKALIEAGYGEGKMMRRILQRLQEARWDGEVSDIEEEWALVRREFQ